MFPRIGLCGSVTTINREQFGKNIIAERKAKGWQQKDLAKKIGESSAVLSGWELGKHLPGLQQLLMLSSVLRVPVSRLLGGKH